MSSIAEQMKSASLITQQMVRQALQEAKTDPAQLQHLQHVVDQGGVEQKFEDKAQLEVLIQFVLEYNCDRFVVQPNTQNALPRAPIVNEARITKVENKKQTIDTTPPPPSPPPGRYRDPLNLTGTAEAGAKVEFYNASRPGRPLLDTVTVGADGKWSLNFTEESKFAFGDQIGVRVVDAHGEKSKPVIVQTAPFLVTNTEITYTRYGQVTGNETRVTHQALDPHRDDVDPFYQRDKVAEKTAAPTQLGEPWSLELRGKDDSCEPNAKIVCTVNGETFQTTADDEGKWALKIKGFTPGDLLRVMVTDVNNRGIPQLYQTQAVQNDMTAISNGMFKAPSLDMPVGAEQTIGTTGPWVAWKASEVCPPFGAVVVRNKTTGDVFEMKADEKGNINAAVGGISERDVLEIAVRDVNGIFSPKTETAVVLPEKLRGQKGFLVPTAALDRQSTADVSDVLQSIKGPPVDLVRNGVADPRGPFLRMPDTCGLPPFGRLAVVRDGEVIQTLSADGAGRLRGLLAGVHVGDQLNFRVLDAAGRQFPGELSGWTVPDAGKTSKVGDKLISSADRSITDCLNELGKGSLDLPHEWVEPFRVTAQGGGPVSPNVRLHWPREAFGNDNVDKTQEQNIGGITQPLLDLLKPPPVQQGYQSYGPPAGHTLELKEHNGTKRIEGGHVIMMQDRNRGGGSMYPQPVALAYAVGVDFVMGTVNAGDPNVPIRLPNDLANLTNLLKHTLTMTAAAYDQGKEHGDVAYARGMSTVKTMLYVFDRLAADPANAAHKDAIIKAAKDAFPSAGFPFELADPNRVPLASQVANDKITGTRTSTLSLVDARAAAAGRAELPTQGGAAGTVQPARVESAIVLRRADNQGQSHEPLRVKGRGQPGDIVQIFNSSTSGRQLLAETMCGPDGKFEIVATPPDIQYGDKLAITTLRDGVKSRTQLVPTDGYQYNGHDLKSAVPTMTDSRAPFLQQSLMEVVNKSLDDHGKVKAGGPRWELNGNELAVEPLSKITVRSKTADGRAFEQTVQADEDGRFKLEFPALSYAQFEVIVKDAGGMESKTRLSTPGLTDAKKVTGDIAADIANGTVVFHLPSGDVRGTLVEHSYAASLNNNDPNIRRIGAADRNDAFVDVILQVPYKQVTTQNTGETHYFARFKIPKEQAKTFTSQVNERISFTCPAIATLPIDKNSRDILEIRQDGPALILDRDFVVPS